MSTTLPIPAGTDLRRLRVTLRGLGAEFDIRRRGDDVTLVWDGPGDPPDLATLPLLPTNETELGALEVLRDAVARGKSPHPAALGRLRAIPRGGVARRIARDRGHAPPADWALAGPWSTWPATYGPVPTTQEIEAARLACVRDTLDATEHAIRRNADRRPLAEYVEAIVEREMGRGEKLATIVAEETAIRQRYPRREPPHRSESPGRPK